MSEPTPYRWISKKRPTEPTIKSVAMVSKVLGLTTDQINYLMTSEVSDDMVLRELQSILTRSKPAMNMNTGMSGVVFENQIRLRILKRLPSSSATDYSNLYGGDLMVPTFIIDSATHVENCCLVQVMGDTMEPVLHSGSYAVCDTGQKDPRFGNVFVLRYNGEMIIREVKVEGKDILLIPANKKYRAQRVESEDDYAIIGKVIGQAHFSTL